MICIHVGRKGKLQARQSYDEVGLTEPQGWGLEPHREDVGAVEHRRTREIPRKTDKV